MIVTRPVRGIVPVLLTPLTASGEIDTDALSRLVEFLVAKPIGGLWVLGTGSEDMNLTFAQRLTVAKTACAANAGRVPLILGAGFFCMQESLDFMAATESLPCDGYHVMPYHPLLSLDRLRWFYERLAEAAPRPLWMYTSGNWARAIPPEFVADLKDHPNIAGIKFSNVNAVMTTKVCRMASEGFQVITAVASQLVACLAVGSLAHTSSLGSALPEPMIEIYEHFQAGRHAEALAAQHTLNDFLAVMGTQTKKDNFLQAGDEKAILANRGICEPYVTSYYRQATPEERQRLAELCAEYGYC